MGTLLVLDLGTTYFKAALFDRDGRLLTSACLTVPQDRSPCRAELSTASFAALIDDLLMRTSATSHFHDVEALTFATQTNSFLLLDSANQPLTPIILWPDERAAAFAQDVDASARAMDAPAITGVPRITSQFMAPKLAWLQRYHPQIWKHAARICLIGDYLTLRFTGRFVGEAGTAALTGLLDLSTLNFSPPALARFDIPMTHLPAVLPAGSDLGPILPDAAQRYGLPPTCRFILGCLDQYAGAIGAGNVEPGRLSETTGTVLATVRCTDRLQIDPGLDVFQGPGVASDRYFQMSFGSVSANYLEWLRARQPDALGFEQLVALAEHIPVGADGLRLRPVASLAESTDVFANLGPQHSRGHQVRCILEGVADALRRQVATLCRDALPDEIRSVGGAARSPLWLQIKADVLGLPVRAVDCPEPTCMGAAVLAEAALRGVDAFRVAGEWVRPARLHRPDPERHRKYMALEW